MSFISLNLDRSTQKAEKRDGINVGGLFSAAWAALTNTQPTSSGELINEAIALQHVSVYASVRCIAESVGSLTPRLYKRLPKGREEAVEDPLWSMLTIAPNDEMSAPVVWESIAGCMALIGSLIAEAYASGGAAIECSPFTALVGQLALSIFPAGTVTITGLLQQTLYYVYYIDPNLLGGNVTPIATTNKSDFLGKNGYFLIDSIVTPYAAAGVSGSRYAPSTFSDVGTRSTTSPSAAYDGNLSSYATVSGGQSATISTEGTIVYEGFPSVVPSYATVLTVTASAVLLGLTIPAGALTISASVGGTGHTLASLTASSSQTNYTLTIPAGTPLNTITVVIDATANPTVSSHPNTVSGSIAEIYIQ